MPRECAGCYFTGNKKDYSQNQWRKGDGCSLCPDCVDGKTGGGGGGGGRGGATYYDESSSDDGYGYGGSSFECSQCDRVFHEQNYSSARVAKEARDKHERDAHDRQQLKFYHGTTWARAQKIQREGMIPSEGGCLGPGIYVAREDKARRFAENSGRHGSANGGLVEVLVSFCNAKYVGRNDAYWQSEGFDACRASETSASTNMEWCIKDARQVQVLRIEKINLRNLPCPVCGHKFFANIAHAVQHVESGSCPSCPGRENAARQIYQFVSCCLPFPAVIC